MKTTLTRIGWAVFSVLACLAAAFAAPDLPTTGTLSLSSSVLPDGSSQIAIPATTRSQYLDLLARRQALLERVRLAHVELSQIDDEIKVYNDAVIHAVQAGS